VTQISRAKVIINPVAGGGSIHKQWPRICSQLRDVGISFDFEFTSGPGHAIEIAKKAIDADYRYLIAVGGDGTINEVANGLLRSKNSDNAILGIVGAGTANCFGRSLGIPQDHAGAGSNFANRKTISIDVGVLNYWSHGQPLQRFFLNEASIGFGAAIVNTWKYLPNRFGRIVNNKLRAITGYSILITHRNKRVKLHIDDEFENIYVCYVVVANGKFIADGMLIAPHARLDDGSLNLVTIGAVNKSEMLRIVSTIYDGSHIKHPEIRERKVKSLAIESNDRLLIEADGEILGECPASFRVLPTALSVVVL
jgi:diacylglycerol kinase (ATP)